MKTVLTILLFVSSYCYGQNEQIKFDEPPILYVNVDSTMAPPESSLWAHADTPWAKTKGVGGGAVSGPLHLVCGGEWVEKCDSVRLIKYVDSTGTIPSGVDLTFLHLSTVTRHVHEFKLEKLPQCDMGGGWTCAAAHYIHRDCVCGAKPPGLIMLPRTFFGSK